MSFAQSALWPRRNSGQESAARADRERDSNTEISNILGAMTVLASKRLRGRTVDGGTGRAALRSAALSFGYQIDVPNHAGAVHLSVAAAFCYLVAQVRHSHVSTVTRNQSLFLY